MQGRKPPRIPSWLLVAASALVLGGAVTLFIAERRGSSDDVPTPSTPTSGVDGELELPKRDGETPTDSRRRGTTGRAGASDRTTTTSTDADADDTDAPTRAANPTAATLRNVRDVTIALAPSSATAEGATRKLKVGTLATTCGSARNVDALAVELALLDRIERDLVNAGARVVRVDDAQTRELPCRDVRARTFATAAWFLVVSATAEAETDALVDPARRASSGAAPRSAVRLRDLLVGELQSALELTPAATSKAMSAASARRALDAGAVATDDAVPGALYRFSPTDLTGSQLDERARQIVAGLAGAATSDDR